jgi:hypothetical protein
MQPPMITLDHGKSTLDRRADIGRLELKPTHIGLHRIAQRRHESAITAADIEHTRMRRDVARDEIQVGPLPLAHEGAPIMAANAGSSRSM